MEQNRGYEKQQKENQRKARLQEWFDVQEEWNEKEENILTPPNI